MYRSKNAFGPKWNCRIAVSGVMRRLGPLTIVPFAVVTNRDDGRTSTAEKSVEMLPLQKMFAPAP